jgi:hypothetical protein
MANFPGLILTDAGRDILAKALTGQTLTFTRVALGDGTEPATPETLTGLVNELQTISIQSFEVIGDGTSKIRAILTNVGITTGFFVREIGVFAQDPDTLQEVLYSYANSGSQSDFMPAEGGATIVEQVFDLFTVVDTATTVTAVIDDFITIATKADIEEIRPYILPTGGLVGQLLRKASNAEGDTEWFNPSEGLDVLVASISETRTATAGQRTFNLSSTITNGLAVYVEGVRLRTDEWVALNATQVQLDLGLPAGTKVEFINNEEVGQFVVASVSLVGPSLVFPGSSNTYTITDFDGFSTYVVTSNIGTVSRTNETITLVIGAAEPAGNLNLVVERNGAAVTFQVAIGAQSVAQPEILNPASGAIDVGSGVTVTTSAFLTYPNGADTHASTDWQIATDTGFTAIVFQSLANATNLEAIDVPSGTFNTSTVYYIRARHNGTTLGASPYSATVSFTTDSSFGPSVIGEAFGGGFYAGNIVQGGAEYYIIVAPKSSGESTSQFKTTSTASPAATQTLNNGPAATAAMVAAGSHPAAAFCAGRTIGGFSDWYLPARDEIELLYRNLKPDTTSNSISNRAFSAITYPEGNDLSADTMGVNRNSIPLGVGYTAADPLQTPIAIFQQGGAEAFSNVANYWSSTEFSDTVSWVQSASNGGQSNGAQKSDTVRVRAVRRIPV